MRLINFQVELLPNKEVIVNGRRLDNCRAEIEESVLRKMDLYQQYALLCESWKMLNIQVDNYNKARAAAGEINDAEYAKTKGRIISAAAGIPGVIKPLPRGQFTGKTS